MALKLPGIATQGQIFPHLLFKVGRVTGINPDTRSYVRMQIKFRRIPWLISQ